tara:strand:+ start:287 stop:559 length:273 start_codon:yes stop_codon:yes gene_type:complete
VGAQRTRPPAAACSTTRIRCRAAHSARIPQTPPTIHSNSLSKNFATVSALTPAPPTLQSKRKSEDAPAAKKRKTGSGDAVAVKVRLSFLS